MSNTTQINDYDLIKTIDIYFSSFYNRKCSISVGKATTGIRVTAVFKRRLLLYGLNKFSRNKTKGKFNVTSLPCGANACTGNSFDISKIPVQDTGIFYFEEVSYD